MRLSSRLRRLETQTQTQQARAAWCRCPYDYFEAVAALAPDAPPSPAGCARCEGPRRWGIETYDGYGCAEDGA